MSSFAKFMSDFSYDDVYVLLIFLVPGFIILSARSLFVATRNVATSEKALLYLIVSIIYHAATLKFYKELQSSSLPENWIWLPQIFLVPWLIGGIWGTSTQGDWSYNILRKAGLNPIHPIPTAWDWKFGNMTNEWVLVTLKDGTRIAGICDDKGAFMSSDPAERDLYLRKVWYLDDKDIWEPEDETHRGIFVCGGEIRTIEFWSYAPEEETNEQ